MPTESRTGYREVLKDCPNFLAVIQEAIERSWPSPSDSFIRFEHMYSELSPVEQSSVTTALSDMDSPLEGIGNVPIDVKEKADSLLARLTVDSGDCFKELLQQINQLLRHLQKTRLIY